MSIKRRLFFLILVFLIPLLLVAADYLIPEQKGVESKGLGYIAAYQSNDDRLWQIWCHRTVSGQTDTVRVSPDIDPGAGRAGYSEPTLMAAGWTIYCAMLVHKQVSGDSAYVMVRRSTDFGDTWETLATIGESQAIARSLRANYLDGELHLIWEDCRSGYWRIYHEEITNL
ncbi:MAG: hypothetical protein AMJ41_02825 [candidate division Zixibacteria bacterium DG_27]|nr:MAG: hypothetical protein AMJ41_02825 [candidate division Zixibacteria bacterium DG_27]